MADAIVSAVAQRLTDMVVEQILDEVNLVRGVKKEVLSLSSDLKNVRKLLDDAERKGCESESVRGWLRRLENATYEMDDVLDEWNIALIKFRMQRADAPPQESKIATDGIENPVKCPQGLAKLTSLQTLDEFGGGGDWNKLGLLNKLNRLTGSLHLLIKLVDDEEDDIVEQAREAELRKKLHLQQLFIAFVDDMNEGMSMRKRLDVMDALEPHPNLQYLEINYYEGSRFPKWIASPSFHQLREIDLFYWASCPSLPHLGKLPCLEVLRIEWFPEVEFVGREFLGITSSSSIGFPKLKILLFNGCRNWKEWEDITAEEQESAAVSVMPSLMELEIERCDSLKEQPHRLLRKAASLQKLRIIGSRQLEEAYKEDGGPLTKFISHIPNVVFSSPPDL